MAEHRGLLPWQELGIAPTADLPAIRRAYALRLKAIDIEREPAAFQRLRAAYEALLRRSEPARPAEQERADIDIDDFAPAREGEAAATAAPIRAAIAAGQFETAFVLLESASERGALALSEQAAIEAEFLRASAHARELPGELLLRLARRFDWETALHPLRAVAAKDFEALDRRLDAEHWYRQLLAWAARPLRLRDDTRRFVARQMLRPAPRWYARCGPASWRLMLGAPLKLMTAELKQFALHRDWAADRFDPGRIRWCQRSAVPGRAVPAIILLCASPTVAKGLLADNDPSAVLVTLGFLESIGLVFWLRNVRRARRLWRTR